jgi:hypothetical protein
MRIKDTASLSRPGVVATWADAEAVPVEAAAALTPNGHYGKPGGGWALYISRDTPTAASNASAPPGVRHADPALIERVETIQRLR